MKELKPKIYENGIEYILAGDYYIPNLKIPNASGPIGRWGRMHRTFLEETHPIRIDELTLSGELWNYLYTIDAQAQERYETIVQQLKEQYGISEELKESNQMEWVRQMNSIRIVAEELVCHELIYC